MYWFIPIVDHIPHAILGALAIASAVRFQYQRAAGIAFHAITGLILLIWPSLLYGPLVYTEFDVLHSFLQRFAGAFHLGFAFFGYQSLHNTLRVEPIVHFAKALTAGFLLFTHLFTAYHLSNPGVRGVRFNHSYLLPILLTDGIWAAVEIYRFIRSPRLLTDEIDLIAKRTQRIIERNSNLNVEKVLLADSALSFIYAFTNFAFPNQILKLVIKNRFLLDGAHKLFSRQFGCYMLFSAIVSLLGSHFTVQHQKNYLLQRILTQGLIIALHAFGHFVLGIYDLSHITPFVVAVLYESLLTTLYYKIHRQEEEYDVDENGGVNKRTVVTYRKTSGTRQRTIPTESDDIQ
jgi:hypothetical protein